MNKQEIVRAWYVLSELLDTVCKEGDVGNYVFQSAQEIQTAMDIIEKKLGL